MRAFCNLMIFSILDNLCIGTVIFTSVFLEVWPFYYPHPLLCSSPTVYQVCSLETLTASRGARGGLCVCVCVCVANAVEKTVFGRADLCQGEDLIYFTVIILTLSLLDPGGYYARISLVRI